MYRLETTPKFDREFKKLDKYTQKIIISWIRKNFINCSNPYLHGKALRVGQLRYRIGSYRLICEIQDNQLVILALSIDHQL